MKIKLNSVVISTIKARSSIFEQKYIGAIIGLGLLLVLVGFIFGICYRRTAEVKWNSVPGKYRNAAIATDGAACAPIGLNVLREKGTAVDATIATLFCNGLYTSQSMGIGGGFVMTIYKKSSKTVETLDAREVAPQLATTDMFDDDPNKSKIGPLSVAVPGEIKGYYAAKVKYGNPKISWKSLIEPSIRIAEEGITVSASQAKDLESEKVNIFNDPGLREIFVNPATNDTWKEGDTYKRLNLANTLRRIANNGSDEEFYHGETAEKFVADLSDAGGIITMDDLKNYDVVWAHPVKVDLGSDNVLYSMGPPSSGVILAYILNILKYFNITPEDDNPLMYHRTVEAFKWAYGERSKLGDPFDTNITHLVDQLVVNMTSDDFAKLTNLKINDSSTENDPSFYGGEFLNPNDGGTSQTSVLASNGDAVSVTSTINLHFGARIMSRSTGIIYNDEMDDFSYPNITNNFQLPPSPHNFPKPGKRPLSSMAPVIIVNNRTGKVRMVTGAAGGSRITTATAWTILRNLWLQQDIKTSIEEKRIHHQLVPMRADLEEGINQDIIDGLISRGHEVGVLAAGLSAVAGVSAEGDGFIYAHADERKSGSVAGF